MEGEEESRTSQDSAKPAAVKTGKQNLGGRWEGSKDQLPASDRKRTAPYLGTRRGRCRREVRLGTKGETGGGRPGEQGRSGELSLHKIEEGISSLVWVTSLAS